MVIDSHPLPCIEENIEKLAGSTIYSTLDAASAYNIIPVEKRSKPYLAFVCAFGSFTFKRMPFGATYAGATYSRFVNLIGYEVSEDCIRMRPDYVDKIMKWPNPKNGKSL